MLITADSQIRILCVTKYKIFTVSFLDDLFFAPPHIFVEIYDLHHSKKNYSFSNAANEYLDAIDKDFIKELNESLLRGEVTPKSKRSNIIQRVAVCLHVFNHVTSSLLRGRKPHPPSLEVSLETVKRHSCLPILPSRKKQLVLDVTINEINQ